METLKDKIVLITGGSRGIGRAIAERCARGGANLAILAKDHDLQTTCAELKKFNVEIIGVDVDVSETDNVEAACQELGKRFHHFDALVNNVSSFCFNKVENTSPEDFDRLFSVNVRATFYLSKICFNYLKNASNPHILNIAPPLNLAAMWFKNHLAFSMSKISMSMCTLGMAQEFKKTGIAVNSLWPQTTIATSTIKDYFTAEVYRGSRWPSIMADAAYEILCRDAKQSTGNFYIDEHVLRESGITDFTQYAVDPTATLIQDLFVTEKIANSQPLMENLFIQQP